ncbi:MULTISPECIES: nuclease-related domain-containing protein [Pontibacillus]|uniref:Nuclease-related domain-containing protein n=1 Tax=Pontibacillus chungwhensis TaxID=265426 RepID=A0ABY8V4A4_9BACI|nr:MULTISPECIES: nuclease-related domain-containing protein [Pontibacillus]MCD5324254.1 NERD domain-containing protein [Pontibacillus sp. HN14]WIG00259.1 nuclease-related domain-containing protein [Pontibacillus chungwhensis]
MKERKLPPVLLQEEALLRRLPDRHGKRSILEGSLSKRWAGYRGEQALDYELKTLPFRKYFIFHDLRLRVFGSSFQIDTLVLTPQVAFLIEVKNIAGTLSLNGDGGQFTRLVNGREERLPSPLAQVKAQQSKFENWLHFHKIYSYPIVPIVAISNATSRLDIRNTSVRVTHLEETLEQIKALHTEYENRRSYDLTTLSRLLNQEHTPFHSNITSAYSIAHEEILKGIQCPQCQQYSMMRINRLWECPFCQKRSSTAHRQAIVDYFLLFNSALTNRKCCEQLLLPYPESQQLVSKLLKRMRLSYEGSTKGRKYHRPDDMEKWIRG